jgi:hypothetical protein
MTEEKEAELDKDTRSMGLYCWMAIQTLFAALVVFKVFLG